MSKPVLFNDSEDVLEAFDKSGLTVWAVMYSSKLQMKGSGRQSLEQWLSMVERGMSNATFDLCLYEGVQSHEKVKSNTPYDYSFAFKLNNDKVEERRTGIEAFRRNRLEAVEDKLDKLTKLLEEPVEEPKEKPHKMGMIGDILNHPTIAPIVPFLVQTLITNLTGGRVQIPMAAQAIPTAQGAALGNVTQETKIQQAIAILKTKDPLLGDHLLKLADIAQQNPQVFTVLINTLEQSQ